MLYVVATPIGHLTDISYHAVELLKKADMVIGEEKKEVIALLRNWEATGRPVELLNEHSDSEDIEFLTGKCKELKTVVLVSDCGTPGFCDPGALLVSACRKNGVPVRSVPGPSSLMSLLSVSGYRLDEFHFKGFLPAKKELREPALKALKEIKVPIVIMDTPYRLGKTLEDMVHYFPENDLILGLSMSSDQERVLVDKPRSLFAKFKGEKEVFILIVLIESKKVSGRGTAKKKFTPRNKGKRR